MYVFLDGGGVLLLNQGFLDDDDDTGTLEADEEEDEEEGDGIIHGMFAQAQAAGHAYMPQVLAADTLAWALCLVAFTTDAHTELQLPREEAVDNISAEDLVDGAVAYVLNGTFSSPLTEESLRKLFLTHSDGRQLDPFTRAPLVSVVKVRVRVAAADDAPPSAKRARTG